MLYNLKKQIKQGEMTELLMESMTANKDDAIKSMFLDGFDADVLGAENDPEVKSLADTIPEYDDHDDQLEAEIHTLTESLVETEI